MSHIGSMVESDAVRFSKLEGRDEKCGNISDRKLRIYLSTW